MKRVTSYAFIYALFAGSAYAQSPFIAPSTLAQIERNPIRPATPGTIARDTVVEGAARVWATPALVMPLMSIGRPPFYEPKPQNPPVRRTSRSYVMLTVINTSAQSTRVSIRCLGSNGETIEDLPERPLQSNAAATFEIGRDRDSGGTVRWCRMAADHPVLAGGVYVWEEYEGAAVVTQSNSPFNLHVMAR